jgi:hypothetical protein
MTRRKRVACRDQNGSANKNCFIKVFKLKHN